jgi:uncharacterized protein
MENFPQPTESRLEKMPGVREEELQELKNTISCFPAITKAIMFGSRIKGGHRDDSDLDIYIEVKGKSKSQISVIKARIQEMLAPIIPYPIHVKEAQEMKNNRTLLRIIEIEGIQL